MAYNRSVYKTLIVCFLFLKLNNKDCCSIVEFYMVYFEWYTAEKHINKLLNLQPEQTKNLSSQLSTHGTKLKYFSLKFHKSLVLHFH